MKEEVNLSSLALGQDVSCYFRCTSSGVISAHCHRCREMVERIRAAKRHKLGLLWLTGLALAMGLGIWFSTKMIANL